MKEWIAESGVDIGEEKDALALKNRELDLVDRAVRVEDERFSHMEKRTAFIQWVTGLGFTAIALLIVVFNYLG